MDYGVDELHDGGGSGEAVYQPYDFGNNSAYLCGILFPLRKDSDATYEVYHRQNRYGMGR